MKTSPFVRAAALPLWAAVALALPVAGAAADRAAADSAAPALSAAPDNAATDNVARAPAAATDNAAAAPPHVPLDNVIRAEAKAVMEVAERKHAALEETLLDRVVWFDTFFGNVRTEESRPTEYLLRWVNALRWEEGGRLRYRTSLRASVRLPRLGRKLHLVVAGESSSEPGAGNPEDPGNPGFDRTLQNTRLVNTELRYNILQSAAQNLFAGAGVRVRLPMEAFVRTRYQRTFTLGTIALVRAGETVFWTNRAKFGETTEIDIERRVGDNTVFRSANSGTLSQKSQGLEWGSDQSLQRALTARSAVTLAAGVFGATRPAAVVSNYRVLARYRRNFLTDWLYFELEPELSWPRRPDGGRTSAWAFTGRIETVFRGSTADVP